MQPKAPAPPSHPAFAQRGQAPHALLSGGGSGGHVFPALAVAAELRERGWEVSWIGSTRGREARWVEQRGIPFFAFDSRPVVGQGWGGKLRAAAGLLGSTWNARKLIRELEAQVVLGTGGYVSVPAVVGGRLAARPVLLLEPNAEPGVANRWLSYLATEAAVAYEGTGQQLHCPSRTTGIPVRGEFFAVDPHLPAAPPLRILVLGGSQGAQQLNDLVPQALAALGTALPPLAVCHQVGERHLDRARAAYDRFHQGEVQVEIVPFLDDVAAAMARSHLVISRAGAITLAELCAAGRPAILVPLLAAAGGHQVANAQRLVAAGAARMLEPQASAPQASAPAAAQLAALISSLLRDPAALAQMAAAARQLSHQNAAVAIADRLEVLGGGH